MYGKLRIAGFAIATLTVALDQWVKAQVLTAATAGVLPVKIFPFFNIVLVFNRGISFGMMADARNIVSLLLPVALSVIVVLLVIWLLRAKERLVIFALGLIIGGAVGNLMDRARVGSVTDFLDFHIGRYHWPAFNVADSAICVGVMIYMFTTLVKKPVQQDE